MSFCIYFVSQPINKLFLPDVNRRWKEIINNESDKTHKINHKRKDIN